MSSFIYAENPSIVRFYNAHILKDHALQRGELWCAEGKIVAPQEYADIEIDLKGHLVAPGYIDIQINGAFGIDFTRNPERVSEAAAQLTQYGVTAILPTVISTDQKRYKEILKHLQPQYHAKSAEILGIHLEGPFFDPTKKSAHDPQVLQPIPEDIEKFYGGLEGVRIVTLAPELPGASQAIKQLKQKNIVVSAGHTCATYEESLLAFENGVSLATHLFNVMPPLHQRSPGLIGAVLTHPDIYYSVITDNIHVHPSILNLMWRASPTKYIPITDAMEALGLEEGTYHLGTMSVTVKEGKPVITGTETIAGSVLSMDKAVRNLIAATKCSIPEALEAASLRPAQLLGIDKQKGTLNLGADADLIVLDDELQVVGCYIRGELAWQKE